MKQLTQKLHVWYGGTSGPYLGQVQVSLHQCQGHILKNSYLAKCLWFYMSKFNVIYSVKVISRSRSFQGQIVSVWLSVSKWEVVLWLKGILVLPVTGIMCLLVTPCHNCGFNHKKENDLHFKKQCESCESCHYDNTSHWCYDINYIEMSLQTALFFNFNNDNCFIFTDLFKVFLVILYTLVVLSVVLYVSEQRITWTHQHEMEASTYLEACISQVIPQIDPFIASYIIQIYNFW